MPASDTSSIIVDSSKILNTTVTMDTNPESPGNYLDIYDNVHVHRSSDDEDKRIKSRPCDNQTADCKGTAHNSNEVDAICSHDNQFAHGNPISSDFVDTYKGDNEEKKDVRGSADKGNEGNYGAADVADYPFGGGYNPATNMGHQDTLADNRQFASEAEAGQFYGQDGYQRLDENENVDNNIPLDVTAYPASGGASPHHQEYPGTAAPAVLEPLNEEDEMELYQAAMEGQMQAVQTLIRHGEADEVAMMSDEAAGEKGRTMIHAAVHAHCTDVIEVVLGHGANPDVQDADGETPLHLAIRLAFVDIVQTLINKGANANIEDEQGRTPLQLCLNIDKQVTPSDVVMINMLLPSTDFSICDFDGISCLHCLAYWDLWSQLEVALSITKSGMVKDNRGRTPLHYCFMNPGHVGLDAAYILIRVDASIMIKDFDGKTPIHRLMAHPIASQNQDVSRFIRDFICAEIKNNDGHSLLHLSTIGNDAEMLKFLYRCGTEMDDKDADQNTALHIAVQRNQTDMVRVLLHCGASPNIQDQQQQSPLHLTATLSRISAAKLLLNEGAEVDLRDERGRTALHRSVHAGLIEMTKLLVNSEANVNATDFSESIPLHYAVSQDKYEIVDLLLTRKSKVNYSDVDGRTPLHLAVRTGNGDLLRILILFGAFVNEYDRYGQTPLHIAAELGKSEAVQTLMNRGANDCLRDSEGKRAEQVAEDRGSMRVMKVMKDHRDSMIMYSQENLAEQASSETNPVAGYLSKSTNSIVACVSHQALDDIEEMEDLVEYKKPTSNGMASLSKLESSEEEPVCGCCRVQ